MQQGTGRAEGWGKEREINKNDVYVFNDNSQRYSGDRLIKIWLLTE